MFWDAIEMIKPGHSRPTKVECTRNMSACPVENLHDFIPIAHSLIIHCFNGCARNNHAIKFLLRQFCKVFIEHHHVLNGRMLGRMALQPHKNNLDLQRCVRKQADKIGLCCDFKRHQVQNHNP